MNPPKKCLVTGGAGFIGSHLVELLLARGNLVTVVDDESTGRRQNLARFLDHPQLRYVAGDVGRWSLIEEVTDDVDEVYHLAAAVGVALIASRPIESIERNIYPTELLLKALRMKAAAGKSIPFFLASTSEVYGKNPKSVWTEDDDLVFGPTTRARWSYGASKAIDEFLALACWRENRLPVVIGRFFNVVGPRQTGANGMVLPRFVDAALANRPLIVHDDGNQVRCFAHVNDVVESVVRLMDCPSAFGRAFNIGSDEPVSILELATRVVQVTGSRSKIEFQSYAEAYDEDFEDIRRRVPDLSRIRRTISYSPAYDLDAIIRELVGPSR
ncbi:MAG: NAD-dependent epimerase/dehydratase family protein [Planctomycetes bacterium]|nr:NAD-dependent epimerase/dehydratase family protein [Planctomycetota bacterium]